MAYADDVNLIGYDIRTISCLRKLEKVKATYLKKASGLSKHAQSRTVNELTEEPFLIEELLPSTRSYDLTLNELQRKKAISLDFYSTEAMTTEDWKQTNYELRPLVTRMAVHGFHHKICATKYFHEPGPDCVRELCDTPCARYHVLECKNRG